MNVARGIQFLTVVSLWIAAAPAAAHGGPGQCRRLGQHAQRVAVERIVEGVERPEDVAGIYSAFYAQDAEFNDPLGTAEGLPAIIEKVVGGFELIGIDDVESPEYTNNRRDHWLVSYVLKGHFQRRQPDGTFVQVGAPFALEAVTSIRFDECGKVYYHRDYYDLLIGTFGQVPGLVDQAFGTFFGWYNTTN